MGLLEHEARPLPSTADAAPRYPNLKQFHLLAALGVEQTNIAGLSRFLNCIGCANSRNLVGRKVLYCSLHFGADGRT